MQHAHSASGALEDTTRTRETKQDIGETASVGVVRDRAPWGSRVAAYCKQKGTNPKLFLCPPHWECVTREGRRAGGTPPSSCRTRKWSVSRCARATRTATPLALAPAVRAHHLHHLSLGERRRTTRREHRQRRRLPSAVLTQKNEKVETRY